MYHLLNSSKHSEFNIYLYLLLCAVKVIDGVMRQLLSRDLMYEPMKQICERFPAWLATNKYVHISETPKLLSFRVIKCFIFLMRLLFAVTSAINSPSFSQSSLPLSSSLFSFLLSLPPRPSLYNSSLYITEKHSFSGRHFPL